MRLCHASALIFHHFPKSLVLKAHLENGLDAYTGSGLMLAAWLHLSLVSLCSSIAATLGFLLVVNTWAAFYFRGSVICPPLCREHSFSLYPFGWLFRSLVFTHVVLAGIHITTPCKIVTPSMPTFTILFQRDYTIF